MTTRTRQRQAIAIPNVGRGAGWWEHEDGGGYSIALNSDNRWGYFGPGPREVVDMTGIASGYRIRKRIQHGDVDWVLTYNGTDFAENKFSVVMEQFYFDYIGNIRKKAIVKGPTFDVVKTAIAA